MTPWPFSEWGQGFPHSNLSFQFPVHIPYYLWETPWAAVKIWALTWERPICTMPLQTLLFPEGENEHLVDEKSMMDQIPTAPSIVTQQSRAKVGKCKMRTPEKDVGSPQPRHRNPINPITPISQLSCNKRTKEQWPIFPWSDLLAALLNLKLCV